MSLVDRATVERQAKLVDLAVTEAERLGLTPTVVVSRDRKTGKTGLLVRVEGETGALLIPAMPPAQVLGMLLRRRRVTADQAG